MVITVLTGAMLLTAAASSTVSVLIGWHQWRNLKDTNEEVKALRAETKALTKALKMDRGLPGEL